MTGGDLAVTALQLLGVIAAGQTPSAEDLTSAIGRMNALISSMGLRAGTMHKLLRTTKTLAAGTASYTLGSGGDINIVRPQAIEHARLITNTADATPTEVPITVFTDEEWAAIPQKTLTGTLLHGVWYDRGYSATARGILYVWPIPTTSTTQLVLYTREAIVAVDQASAVLLPDGLQEVLEYNTAVRLAPIFERPVPADVRAIARDAMRNWKASNLPASRLAMPAGMPGMRRGRGNIRLG